MNLFSVLRWFQVSDQKLAWFASLWFMSCNWTSVVRRGPHLLSYLLGEHFRCLFVWVLLPHICHFVSSVLVCAGFHLRISTCSLIVYQLFTTWILFLPQISKTHKYVYFEIASLHYRLKGTFLWPKKSVILSFDYVIMLL